MQPASSRHLGKDEERHRNEKAGIRPEILEERRRARSDGESLHLREDQRGAHATSREKSPPPDCTSTPGG